MGKSLKKMKKTRRAGGGRKICLVPRGGRLMKRSLKQDISGRRASVGRYVCTPLSDHQCLIFPLSLLPCSRRSSPTTCFDLARSFRCHSLDVEEAMVRAAPGTSRVL